ncbi:uncharacterized protein SPPG_07157 [Spizellomyces punctatus DAOM BR117]|uniref:JmjC domain-containing protein n=1 Tax=Spizellomyces punctatus (strain DAOM BR117) TaxID=645134 RepID=A0A0L0H842_SPIPD|nr:uncharacterized protein SPPG_07157 [Spizellomyces punctatus DAOM BR117]KNC97695.1 hypothetical protein SPPG_07157 [Spizellomyces punctatus DAOM BR117]|eukprot:XP_016605735.1 hypothetical protein SPPG_07157 [Spizellomyces punctatus DAOM BR117]
MTFANEYKGFHPPSPSWTPDRIDPSTTTPQEFFEKYIATRTPCILTSPIAATNWKASTWTADYLKRRSGDLTVKVERKHPSTGGFGSGLDRLEMRFSDFLKRLENGERDLYMTTQYATHEDKDEAMQKVLEFLPHPLTNLVNDFPLHPELMGHLVPQMVNLWMGSTDPASPTSSGLHHDYQDNLYILLRGKKRFTLFSPRDAEYMYLQGDVARVCANGYILYDGMHRRDDGAGIRDVAEWKVGVAERRLEEAEEAGEGIEEAEKELEAAMDGLMVVSGEDDDVIDDFDDFELLDDENGDIKDGEEEEEDDEDEDEDDDNGPTFARVPQKRSAPPLSHAAKRPKSPPTDPPSFSTIPISELHAPSTKSLYPALQNATKTSCTLASNEMLYLPAGWFHEVGSAGDQAGLHTALNYWFAPPTQRIFAAPYEDGFWEDGFQDVKKELETLK